MQIKRLHIENLRGLGCQTLFPSEQLNIITGANGSGKSTLLEAITILLSGRSFRTTKSSLLTPRNKGDHSENPLLIAAQIERNGSLHQLGYQRQPQNQRVLIREDRRRIPRASILASNYPHLIVSPDSADLVDGNSERRRAYLDWVLFHIEPEYHQLVSDYQRLLGHRNALLRSGTGHWNKRRLDELSMWDQMLAEQGESIDRQRRRLVEQLKQELPRVIDSLTGGMGFAINYRGGWDRDERLIDALSAAREVDRRRRFTSKGPHRADVELPAPDCQASIKEVCSRGEKKLINIAMGLGQILFLHQKTQKRSVLLIDDFYAEFDAGRVSSILKHILSLGIQVFITTPRSEDLRLIDEISCKKVFQLHQGVASEVVYSD